MTVTRRHVMILIQLRVVFVEQLTCRLNLKVIKIVLNNPLVDAGKKIVQALSIRQRDGTKRGSRLSQFYNKLGRIGKMANIQV